MKRFFAIITVLLLWVTTSPLLQAAEEAPAKKLESNAALIYWVAFDQYDAMVRDEAIANAINDWSKAMIDDKLRTVLKESASLSLLRIAAKQPTCDWGTGYMLHVQGPFALMPHMGRTRQLARLGLLSARVHLADKKPGLAIEDVLAIHALARHSQAGDILISMLVGISIEALANTFIADNLDAFDDASLKVWREQIAKLPPMMHVKQAIIGERDGFGGWVKREFAKLDDPSIRQKLTTLFSSDNQGVAVKLLADKAVVAMADDMMKKYEPLVAILDLPPDRFANRYKEWEKEIVDTKNLLVAIMMPAFDVAYHNYHRSLAQAAILHAAIIYRLEGKAAFEKIKDPYGDGPFTFANQDEGIVISSKLSDRDKTPVKLIVKWKPQGK